MDPFQRFVAGHRRDLARIARATGGEQQREDVAQEAWLMAEPLAARYQRPVDFDDPAFVDLLLRHRVLPRFRGRFD